MKKTLTAMALATSILPLSTTSNAESDSDIQELNSDNTTNLDSNENKSIQINRDSQSATILKENSILIDEYGNIVEIGNRGDKIQILKKFETEPFLKVNYNGKVLYIAKEAITDSNTTLSSGTAIKINCSAEIIPLNNEKNIDIKNTDSVLGENIFSIQAGTHVNITEKTNNGWYKIDYFGNTGYINEKYVQLDNFNNNIRTVSYLSDCNTTGVVYNLGTATKLNVRKQPNTSSAIIATLSAGETVNITGSTTDGWYKIDLNGITGYVSKNYIQVNKPNTTKYTVINTAINLRTSASWSGSVYETASVGTVLDVIEIKGEWASIYKNNTTLYAPASHLKQNTSNAPSVKTTKYKVVDAPINLRTSASWSGTVYKTVGVGTILDVIKIDGAWASIHQDGKTLYAPANYLQAVETPPVVEEKPTQEFSVVSMNMNGIVYGIASDDVLNVRETPFYDGKLITSLKNDTKVTVTGVTSNDWYRIDIDGTTGYVNKKYIKEYTPETTKYTVINGAINLRTSASWSGSVYKTVGIGTILNIIKIDDTWATVYYEGKTLYAPANYLQAVETPPVVEEEKPSFTVSDMSMDGVVYNIASDDVLNVRETPFHDGKVITSLKNGTRIKVTGITSNNWYRVEIDKSVGYVNKSYIKEYTPETTKYTVVSGAINLRTSASWSGTVYKTVNTGTTLEVIEINGEWATIYYEGQTLYAPASYLQSTQPIPPEVEEETPVIPPTTEEENKEELPPTVDNDKEEDIENEEQPPVTDNDKEDTLDFTVTDMNMDGVVYNVASDDVLNIRKTPYYDGELITSLKNGTRVKVIGITSNNWYKVDINGTIGYANKKYIKEYIPETTRYTVVGGDINLRTSASWSGDVYKSVSAGTVLNVIEINGEWATIYYDKQTLYAPASYLNNTEDKNTIYTNYPYSLSSYIKKQVNQTPSYSYSTLEEYINPTKCNKFEFLTLDTFREVDVNKIEEFLVSKKAGVLVGQSQALVDVARKYKLDPLYFLSQSVHETGYGKSTLAKGVTITEIANPDKPIKNSNGEIIGYQMIPLDKPTTVYNLYGIGAYDNLPTMPNRALVLGTTYAYNKGWTSVEKALDGAGAFLSSGYIHNSKYDQNTLYKIRFNPNSSYIWHQYATTPWYSRDIAKFIDKYQDFYIDPEFIFDKPLFKGMNPYSLKEISISTMSLRDLDDFELKAKEDITLR